MSPAGQRHCGVLASSASRSIACNAAVVRAARHRRRSPQSLPDPRRRQDERRNIGGAAPPAPRVGCVAEVADVHLERVLMAPPAALHRIERGAVVRGDPQAQPAPGPPHTPVTLVPSTASTPQPAGVTGTTPTDCAQSAMQRAPAAFRGRGDRGHVGERAAVRADVHRDDQRDGRRPAPPPNSPDSRTSASSGRVARLPSRRGEPAREIADRRKGARCEQDRAPPGRLPERRDVAREACADVRCGAEVARLDADGAPPAPRAIRRSHRASAATPRPSRATASAACRGAAPPPRAAGSRRCGFSR